MPGGQAIRQTEAALINQMGSHTTLPAATCAWRSFGCACPARPRFRSDRPAFNNGPFFLPKDPSQLALTSTCGSIKPVVNPLPRR